MFLCDLFAQIQLDSRLREILFVLQNRTDLQYGSVLYEKSC